MRDQRRPGGTVAGDDVDDARRKIGFLNDLRQRQRASASVVSAGLSTIVLPHASAGASFHAAMSSGKFHGTICPGNADRFGIASRAQRPFKFVGPAGIVEEVRRGSRDVEVARLFDRLAAVERLQHRKFARSLRNCARDADKCISRDRPGRIFRQYFSYALRAERTARSTSSASPARRAPAFLVSGVDRLEVPATLRGGPFSADEQPVLFANVPVSSSPARGRIRISAMRVASVFRKVFGDRHSVR